MIKIHPDVQKALKNKQPVVALETTIISHGMPYPKNIETAREVEQIIRDHNATPATIGIIHGSMHVGLDEEQLNTMASGDDILKACERDLPFVLTNKRSAATTVSASLAIAELAGVQVFVTGGIGGVAPGDINAFDISADIPALSRHRCITVSAGVKSFMDISSTLELLETLSIPLMVYRSEYFPEFFTPGDTHQVDWIAENPADVARVFNRFPDVGYNGGLLVTVPVPENDAIDRKLIKNAIEKAKQSIKEQGISGKAFTPLMLQSIVDATGGKSLETNIALIKNNAAVGAKIAVELVKSDIQGRTRHL